MPVSKTMRAAATAPILKPASNQGMIGPTLAAEFWGAVQDCLVQFHNFSRAKAAEKVTDVWRRLGDLASAARKKSSGSPQRSFDEMIYHEEPWYIACNLAEKEMILDKKYRHAYLKILQQNHLA